MDLSLQLIVSATSAATTGLANTRNAQLHIFESLQCHIDRVAGALRSAADGPMRSRACTACARARWNLLDSSRINPNPRSPDLAAMTLHIPPVILLLLRVDTSRPPGPSWLGSLIPNGRPAEYMS